MADNVKYVTKAEFDELVRLGKVKPKPQEINPAPLPNFKSATQGFTVASNAVPGSAPTAGFSNAFIEALGCSGSSNKAVSLSSSITSATLGLYSTQPEALSSHNIMKYFKH